MISQQTYYMSSHLSNVFGQIWKQGGLTARDRQRIMFTLLNHSLCEEEISTIDRILYAVRRGWLQIID